MSRVTTNGTARALFVAAIASALCGRASAQKGGSAPPAKPDAGAPVAAVDPGFSAALRRAAGGSPVLLAMVDNAVEARSADGKFKLVVAPDPVQDAVYDAELELVWVRRIGQLEVWDLREEKPKAIPILADAADDGDFWIDHGLHQVSPGGQCDVSSTMIVRWTKHPFVEVVGLDENAAPRPRLVGSLWLTEQFSRPLRSVAQTRTDLPALLDKTHVVIPRKVGTCADPEDCGGGVPFGNTGWLLVVAAEAPGADCRHFECVLYDPRTKKFGKPPLPGKWKASAQKAMLGECGRYRFEPSGRWFAIHEQVCAVGGTCSTLAESARVIGWLDGEADVGTDE
jgi:hypothetical protein